ncbi:GldG family protein [Candidatus Falkowbacteria bacterium]|nr:GldG family protein [Candidatus Falkowbacteria bacterium]
MKQIIKRVSQWQKQASFGLNVVLVIGVIAVLNFFAYQFFHRFDLTSNKSYSLSQASKSLAKNLPDVINIKVYFSGNLPSQYIGLKQEVLDLLDEYQNYSMGKIKVEVIDPTKDKDVADSLRTKGVPEVQFNVAEKDKLQVVNGYMGMIISYGDKDEVVPVLQDVSNFEYMVSSDIRKLTSDKMPTVGLLTLKNGLNWEESATQAKKSLESLYQVTMVDLKAKKEIPSEVSILVVAGPKDKFSDDELKAIDAYVMHGGSVMFLVDGVKIGDGLSATKNDVGLDKLLSAYGLTLNKDLVLDNSMGVASFNQGFMKFSIPYPYWPKVVGPGFDQANPAVSRLGSLVLEWASSIDVNQDKIGNPKISYLAKTTDQAWHVTDSFNLIPNKIESPESFSQYNLAVAVSGDIKSAFGKGSNSKARIILVGDSDFLTDNLLNSGDNLSFFQNTVDYLGQDEQLIAIRAKGGTSQPISVQLSDGAKMAIRYGNIFGITIIAVAFGFFRYYSRRRNRRRKAD